MNVICEIDWYCCFDYMQQYSGQYLFLVLLIDIYDIYIVSFYLGSEVVFIDLNVFQLFYEQLLYIEKVVNNVIYSNCYIKMYEVKKEDLYIFVFCKVSELEDEIVCIVEIEGIDVFVCCGIYVN